jgi:hypothetical protein
MPTEKLTDERKVQGILFDIVVTTGDPAKIDPLTAELFKTAKELDKRGITVRAEHFTHVGGKATRYLFATVSGVEEVQPLLEYFTTFGKILNDSGMGCQVVADVYPAMTFSEMKTETARMRAGEYADDLFSLPALDGFDHLCDDCRAEEKAKAKKTSIN